MHMSLKNTADRYGHVAQLLHWAVVGLIITQFVLVQIIEDLPRTSLERFETTTLHKSVGITVLLLAIVRLIWRVRSPPPLLPAAMKAWERAVAQVTHWGLYGLMFALPLSGWIWSNSHDFAVSYFGLFELPRLVQESKPLQDVFHEVHEILATLLFALAILHTLAALKHHFFDRDTVLRRMLPWG
jgi:cytochrome b561